jgi:hypothetical protein
VDVWRWGADIVEDKEKRFAPDSRVRRMRQRGRLRSTSRFDR